MVKIFDYFWKSNSLFSKFCVNCLLMFYFLYCNNWLWKLWVDPVNALARCWSCACLKCVSGLRRLEKTLKLLRCIRVFELVLKYGSVINEGNWLQLLFYFLVLMGTVASVIGMSFFQLCFRFWIEVFSYCTLTETFEIGFPKWFDHEWIDFGVFWLKVASFVDFISVWTKICKNCSFVFSDDINFFRRSVRGVFWSVL